MIQFGTGGWRAIIGEDFVAENIRKVAAGILKLARHENKTETPIMIGYDRRFLSPDAAKWVAEVLAKGGITVWFLNRSAPTPFVMHTVKDKKLHYGIEITASHNPSAYNGIKLIVDEGRDAPVETTELLEKFIAEVDEVEYTAFDDAVKDGSIVFLKNPFNKFIDDILAQLREEVVKGGYDLGIALDGDGDRLGIIDSNGRYINANEVLCLLYYYLHEYKGYRGPVVRNIASTHMLDKIAESFGEECIEVPVGFKYVSAALDEYDAVLGGESSGGLTVRGHIFGKDSIYAASLFVEMLCRTGMTATEFITKLEEKYGIFRMKEANLVYAVPDKDRINTLIMIDKKLPDFGTPVKKVSYEDGCKVYFENGDFIICRFSGTEPLLRIFAESSTPEIADGYIEAFRKFVFEV